MTAAPRPVVLLHGLAGTPESWAGVVAALGDRPVRVPELPWRSGADPAWAWTADLPGAALEDTYSAGDLVVAHSYAANLLLERLARPGAPRPAAAVLLSPFFRPAHADFDWATIHHYLVDFHDILAEGVRAAARRAIPADRLSDMAATVRNMVGPYGWMRFFETYLATPALDLDAVRTPLVLVHGDQDDAAPYAEGRELAARLPAARLLTVPGGRHFPMADRPDLVATAVDLADRAERGGVPTTRIQLEEALA